MRQQPTVKEMKRIWHYLNIGLSPRAIAEKMEAAGYDYRWSLDVIGKEIDDAYSVALGSVR